MTDGAGTELLPALRALASLLVVLAAIVAAGWYARRRLGGGRSGRMTIDERLAISRSQQLLLIRVDARHLLVGVGDKGFSLLAELEPETDSAEELAPAAPAAPAAAPEADGAMPAAALRFRALLGHAVRARRSAS